jgi:hypothetical protein
MACREINYICRRLYTSQIPWKQDGATADTTTVTVQLLEHISSNLTDPRRFYLILYFFSSSGGRTIFKALFSPVESNFGLSPHRKKETK